MKTQCMLVMMMCSWVCLSYPLDQAVDSREKKAIDFRQEQLQDPPAPPAAGADASTTAAAGAASEPAKTSAAATEAPKPGGGGPAPSGGSSSEAPAEAADSVANITPALPVIAACLAALMLHLF